MSHAYANGNEIDTALDRFQDERSAARRFHATALGRDVDPDYCMGDFLIRVRNGDRAGLEKHYGSTIQKSALAESSGTTGGYTVPQELSIGLMRDLSTGSLFRRFGAYVQPMTTMTLDLPLPDVTTAQAAGVAPYFGGINLKWELENKSFDQTAPNFRNVELKAWTLGGYVYASNPMLQDALGLEIWLTRLFGWSLAWYQDLAFFAGTGVGQPQGVIGSAAAKTVTRGASGPLTADAGNMIAALLPASYERSVWFCHPTVLPKITAFTGWIPNGPLMLHGRPVVPTDKCSTLATKGDLILVDPALYVIGDRLQAEIDFSREEPTAYLANQGAFSVWSRVDGQPAISGPLTLQDGASTVSPFVVLV